MIKRDTNKEYHSNSAVSKSKLSNMSVNPAYYKWCLENPQPQTESMLFGSAVHKLILEEDDFDNEFVVIPTFNRKTKDGKIAYDMFIEKAKQENKSVITEEQYQTAKEMVEAVRKNRYANFIFGGEKEQSFYFTDDITHIECKARPDCYVYKKGDNPRIIITDYKTCMKADIRSIEKDVIAYSYDLQTYMYRLALSKEYGVPIENIDFLFMFQEKKAPYLINLVQANEFVLQRGENLFREYINTLAYCIENDNFYGYEGVSGEPCELSLPAYLLKTN